MSAMKKRTSEPDPAINAGAVAALRVSYNREPETADNRRRFADEVNQRELALELGHVDTALARAAAAGLYATSIYLRGALVADTITARLKRAGYEVRLQGATLIISWA